MTRITSSHEPNVRNRRVEMKLNFHKARAHIESAEIDLGKLPVGMKVDLLLDNMPELVDSKESRIVVDLLGLTNVVWNSMLQAERKELGQYLLQYCFKFEHSVASEVNRNIKRIIDCGMDQFTDEVY